MNLPLDFTKKMRPLLDGEWDAFASGMEQPAQKALRLNPLKSGLTPEKKPLLLQELGISGQQKVLWAKDAYYYQNPLQPGKHPYHEAGLYYIQEPSAMSAAEALSPQPGERVLDLCAAPGGKTTQLAGMMQQQGLLIANEIHPVRCKTLSQNIERMGIQNAIVTNEDSSRLASRFPEFFHRILVDAPCSGEGMFRKNPLAAEEWSQAQVELCAQRQMEILENAAKMLLSGGRLVYSTCTFSPEENEGVIGWFLKKHKEFSLQAADTTWFSAGNPQWGGSYADEELKKTFRLWPHRLKGEGHFVAILEKQGNNSNNPFESEKQRNQTSENKKKNSYLKRIEKQKIIEIQEFISQTLTPEIGDWLLGGPMALFGEQLYRLPEAAPPLDGIRLLRAGLHAGTWKKNRFEPSHALALTLGRADVKNSQCFLPDDPRLLAYYRGETVQADGEKGWTLVCAGSYSAGWGKRSGNSLKNHYPKGLRREL